MLLRFTLLFSVILNRICHVYPKQTEVKTKCSLWTNFPTLCR